VTDRARAAAALVLIALATGCGGRQEEDAPEHEVLPSSPPVAWADDGHLSVTTRGSSSCPTGPGEVAVTGEQEVVVGIEPVFPDRDPCTADIAPRTTEVALPRGVSAEEELTVRLRYGNGDEETVVLPPAGR